MLVAMRRKFIPAVLLAVGLALAGCSSSGGSSEASLSGGVAPAPQAADGSASGSDSGGATKASGASDVIQRQVVTTGTLSIRTPHPVSAGDRAAQIVDAAGGRVDDRTQSAATRDDPGTASLTLRIPSANLTDTLTALKKLGTVESLKLSTEDVTTKSQDLNARIKALQTSVDRLLTLESKAKNTADLLAIETDLSDRQGDLDSLTAQEKYLSDQVQMSTINLEFDSPPVKEKSTTPAPSDAFTAGLSGFGTFFTWVFLAISYLVPWIVLATIITFGIIGLVRLRRRRVGPLAPPPPPPATPTP